MRIYSMTATFGKLERQTLELKPGLNVIHAPNEWGKSTWCAFLVAMLYGIDTRAKTTKTVIADKERYAPWSGSPMEGRMDLCWSGRDITIERRTKGRTVFGEFKAYDTASGITIPSLTAANCGEKLLGVERNVFLRAGFLRLTDLPVTQDETLRRRLNSLVTTGDESGAGDALAQTLRDLKNRCRYNRSGLLPQAQAQKEELEQKLGELHSLRQQTTRIQARQEELEQRLADLQNHRQALKYTASLSDGQRMAAADQVAAQAAEGLSEWEATCADLPSQEQLRKNMLDLQSLQTRQASAELESRMLPPAPEPPAVQAPFAGMDSTQVQTMVSQDVADHDALSRRNYILLLLGAILAALAGLSLLLIPGLPQWTGLAGLGVLVLGFALVAGFLVLSGKKNKALEAIRKKYGSEAPEQWQHMAREHQRNADAHEAAVTAWRESRGDLDRRLEQLKEESRQLCGSSSAAETLARLNHQLSCWNTLADARRQARLAADHAGTLRAMVKPVEPPKAEDLLHYTEAETARLISDGTFEQRQLQLQLGQCLGQTEALGDEARMKAQLEAITARVRKLEDYYAALSYAQNALTAATAELQQRFAPRISQRAQALFTRLTDGKYDRLTLSEDFSLNAAARDETILHTAQWRSDGTMDQLYLALRLAVAEALTPEAPLILDDALLRFDDQRLEKAMEILQEEGQTKQVILFSCQKREMELA